MNIVFKMDLPNYSEGAIQQVIEQAPGKPFLDRSSGDEVRIGTIVSASRVDSTNMISFEIEVL